MYIGRQQLGGPIAKLDDISSEFDGTKTTFNVSLGATPYFANNPFALMVSIGGVIQEPVESYTIVDNTIEISETIKIPCRNGDSKVSDRIR